MEYLIALPMWVVAVVQAVIALLIIIWLCWRSGSDHLLFAHLWSIVLGKVPGGDQIIDQFFAKRTSLMKLRAATGVRCASLAQAHRLLEWVEANDEDIDDVPRCKGYFDVTTPGLPPKPPSRWEYTMSVSIFSTSVALLVLVGCAALSPRAWGSVKGGTGTQLLIATGDIEVFKSAQHFSKTDCSKADYSSIAARVELPTNEVSIACGWLGDPALNAYVHRMVHQQRVALSVLATILLMYGVPAYEWFSALGAARAMRKRLAKRQDRALEADAEPLTK